MDRETLWLVIRIVLLTTFSVFLTFIIIYIYKTIKEKNKEVNFKLPDLDEEIKKELKSNLVPTKDANKIKSVNDDKELSKIISSPEENDSILDEWEDVLKKQSKKIVKRLPDAEKAVANSENSMVYQKDNFDKLMREMNDND